MARHLAGAAKLPCGECQRSMVDGAAIDAAGRAGGGA